MARLAGFLTGCKSYIRINRIRRKIEADPAKPQAIKTIRVAGYIFKPAGE
ncbi:MAG: winged helix-turn-helix domain-containing protein [Acidiferrobacterales bacterium]